MRLTVSQRIFFSFLSLFLITVALTVSLWVGIDALRQASTDIKELKDFQLAVRGMESVDWDLSQRQLSEKMARFDVKFAELKRRAEAIRDLHADFPDSTRRDLALLDDQIKFFHQAYLDYMNRQEADERIHETQHRLMEELSLQLSKTQSERLRGYFSDMLGNWGRAYHDRDPNAISSLKRIFQQLEEHPLPRDTDYLLDRIDTALDENYINYLGILDRQAFLSGAAKRFSQVADQAVASILEYESYREDLMLWTVGGALGLSLSLTLFLWLLASRHVGRFLSTSRSLIHAFGEGRYQTGQPETSRDEFGDFIRFIQQLGANLEDSLQRIRASEEKYRNLVEEISDWIWETDERRVCVYASPAVERILGRPAAWVQGRPIADFLCGEGKASQTCRSALEESLASAESMLSFSHRTDGSRVVLESAWQPIAGEDGKPMGLRGVTRDVTERHQAEEERQRLESQLLHSQKLEAIGTLSGGVAHDFNNLLQSIGGYSDYLLQRGKLDEADRETVGKIIGITSHAGQLTQQLLLYSRRAETQLSAVDLRSATIHACELLERTIPKMIRIEVDCAPDTPLIPADPVQLEQVLFNLVINARDAIPEGGVITVRTGLVKEGGLAPGDRALGARAFLSVSDNGMGIPDAIRDRIFEPFFTTKATGKGTGLGLSIVYGIAKTHRAEITCDSAPGKGTTFTLLFPVADRELVEKATPVAEPPPTGKTPASATILVVDDEEAIRDSCRELLHLKGYKTCAAATGEEALDVYQARNGAIDLVLLDLNMPGMGGLECCRRLLKIDPEARIVIATGYSESENKSSFLRDHSIGYLKKPYRLNTLLDIIQASLLNPRAPA